MNKINKLKTFSEGEYNLYINRPIIFAKKSDVKYKARSLRFVIADNGNTKHFPPSVQEWRNSIYPYDKNYNKSLPVWDKNLMNLLKSYYSMYCGEKFFKKFEVLKTNNKNKRSRRKSLNNIFVGKGHFKHTSTKVIITSYIQSWIEKNFLKRKYNILSSFFSLRVDKFNLQEKKIRLERITKRHIINKKQRKKNLKITLMDMKYSTIYGDISNMSNVIIKKNLREKISFNRPFIDNEFYKYLQRFYTPKQYRVRELLLKRNLINLELFFTWWLICLPFINNLKLNNEEKYIILKKISDIKSIISSLKKNISSYESNIVLLKKNYYLKKYLVLKYSLKLNIIKSNLNIFIEKLKYLVNKVYNKKVEFKLIKLKKLFLSSDIFTQAIGLKLRNRRNRLFTVLKLSLSKIKLSRLIKENRYQKRKNKLTPVNVIRNKKANSFIINKSKDSFKNVYKNIIPKLILKTKKELKCWTMTSIYPGVVKYRHIAGVKVEAKGRLTRRFTASRAIFKMKQKGGFRNIDSSVRGLSAVILRGHVKSNEQYSVFSSKRRNGAFGIKGWVSNK